MWKQPEPTRRRRPVIECLEDRRLLSADALAPPVALDIVVVSHGPTAFQGPVNVSPLVAEREQAGFYGPGTSGLIGAPNESVIAPMIRPGDALGPSQDPVASAPVEAGRFFDGAPSVVIVSESGFWTLTKGGLLYGSGSQSPFSPGGAEFEFAYSRATDFGGGWWFESGAGSAGQWAGSSAIQTGTAPNDETGGGGPAYVNAIYGPAPALNAFRIDLQPGSPYPSGFAIPAFIVSVPAFQRGRADVEELAQPPAAQPGAGPAGSLSGLQGFAVIVTSQSASANSAAGAAPFAPASVGYAAGATAVRDSGPALADRLVASGGPRQMVLPAGGVDTGRALDVQPLAAGEPGARHLVARPSLPRGTHAAGQQDGEDPSPQRADLIADALPFSQAVVMEALDQFVHELGDLDMRGLIRGGPIPIALFSLAMLSSAASIELARRYFQRKNLVAKAIRIGDPWGRGIPLGSPEWPRSWSERRP
jgi:hypothetical protein